MRVHLLEGDIDLVVNVASENSCSMKEALALIIGNYRKLIEATSHVNKDKNNKENL